VISSLGNGGQVSSERVESPIVANPSSATASPALAGSLRQLMILRTIAVCGQALAIGTSSAVGVALPTAPMVAVMVSLVALNALTWFRLKRPVPASHLEVAGQLAFDLAAFTLLLYFAGGTANPFSLIFVLHVVVMALLLPPLAAAVGALLVVSSYLLVARFHLPLRLGSGEAVTPALLAIGRGLSLALTAGVVAWFVIRTVGALREHERLLREAAQKAFNDEAILKVGTLAAGAAHELASPMTTMAVVAGEMAREASTPSLRQHVGILASQIETCRQTIANLLAAANHSRAEGGGRERLDTCLQGVAARFRTMRPDAVFTCQWEGVRPVPQIFADQVLKQSILALLNNAADASPNDVRMTGRWDEQRLQLTIEDRGGGVPPGHLEKLGRVFFTTKPPGKGTGLGLVLTANVVKQLEGTLRWENRPGGGTQAELVLPLRALRLPEAD
jgi:two-component system, sensor histidine kinase RegB